MGWCGVANEYATFIALIAHTSRVRASNRSCHSCGQSTRNAGPSRLQLNVADTCIVVDVHVISWAKLASCK